MQATLDASSLKTFTKAVVCLSKYGEELTFHITPDALSLAATNSSKSAYCRFKWDKAFFSRYRLNATVDEMDNDASQVKNVTGQLMSKALLSILKHRTVEKSVDRCELSIVEGNEHESEDQDSLESKLILKLHCKHGVLKTHRLLLMSLTSLMAPARTEETCESKMTIGPKALRDLIDHFPVSKSARSDPQLFWTFDEVEVGLKSQESLIDSRGRGLLSTELLIGCEEFDLYDLAEFPVTIGFHLREFLATLAFADSLALSLDLRFTGPAKPLFIDLEGDEFDSLFVIATNKHGSTSHGTQNSVTNSQAVNNKRRDRSESQTPLSKRSMRVVQQTDLKTFGSQPNPELRASSRIPGSMPPPSIIPNYSMSHVVAPQTPTGDGGQQPARQARPLFLPSSQVSDVGNGDQPLAPRKGPLFLPSSSQMSDAEVDVLKSTGLGIENMTAEELNDLLESEGQEVDFSQQRSEKNIFGEYDMYVDQPGSLDLVEETGLPATQSSQGIDKSFQPLFED